MNWNSADMASSNAAFWTGRDSKGDGSETMVLKSRAFCTFFFFFLKSYTVLAALRAPCRVFYFTEVDPR